MGLSSLLTPSLDAPLHFISPHSSHSTTPSTLCSAPPTQPAGSHQHGDTTSPPCPLCVLTALPTAHHAARGGPRCTRRSSVASRTRVVVALEARHQTAVLEPSTPSMSMPQISLPLCQSPSPFCSTPPHLPHDCPPPPSTYLSFPIHLHLQPTPPQPSLPIPIFLFHSAHPLRKLSSILP